MKLWWINVLINEIIVGNVSICEIEEKIITSSLEERFQPRERKWMKMLDQ
jgi:hypothetical protein